tara:strand:- start:719 stop:943 length:225 start_codon:yes stop_codon:yes gene_type:complete
MIDTMDMIEVINEKSGDQYLGEDIEYFIDDYTDVGEVYLDGNLLFQSTSIYNEQDLKLKFEESFSITKEESTNA